MAAFDWSKNSTNQKKMQIHRPMATHVLPRFRQVNWLIWFFTLTTQQKCTLINQEKARIAKKSLKQTVMR